MWNFLQIILKTIRFFNGGCLLLILSVLNFRIHGDLHVSLMLFMSGFKYLLCSYKA